MKKIINAVLILCACGLAFYLGRIIYIPINFTSVFEKRQEVIKSSLLEIKDLQLSYKDSRGSFAAKFDDLKDFIKNDTFQIMKLEEIGFNDKNEPIYDTSYSYMPVLDSLKLSDDEINGLGIIPFSNNEEYKLNAGDLKKGKFTVKVFEVKANYGAFLHDLDATQYDAKDEFKVGSMYEASYAGNW